MAEPVWILEEVARAIHQRQLAEHGGGAGIRDQSLLASALARPRHQCAYAGSESSIPSLAASYACAISSNHPFVDGNKRTAFVVSMLFLVLNGWTLEATREEKYEKFASLAAGALDEAGFARWMELKAVRLKT